ncbi:hypothetical protein PVAP13_8KG058004 [Panicum virgatum]|uniref:Uncharacterized protein n=1 Tax=Panicum virgatum TaxID=38727 RepID=A0A8T0PE29_PANVG|nr:hypothetical protein PVAP13_8KG058004 [Panicum virgatum]
MGRRPLLARVPPLCLAATAAACFTVVPLADATAPRQRRSRPSSPLLLPCAATAASSRCAPAVPWPALGCGPPPCRVAPPALGCAAVVSELSIAMLLPHLPRLVLRRIHPHPPVKDRSSSASAIRRRSPCLARCGRRRGRFLGLRRCGRGGPAHNEEGRHTLEASRVGRCRGRRHRWR